MLRNRQVIVVVLVAVVNWSFSGDVRGSIASAGFNDAGGLHSNGVSDSPYEIGASISGGGVGEPGWAGPWGGGGGLVTVQGATVFEGDGAARLTGTGAIDRELSEVQTGRFGISQRVRFEPGVRMTIYHEQSLPVGNAFQGPIWQVRPDGNFVAIDGTGNACIICDAEETGFTWVPGVWYEVSLLVDIPTQTWEFFVDGMKYESPDPLGYRGSPLFLNQIRYQIEGAPVAYLDELRVVPEPSSAVLAMLLACAVGACRWRRVAR